MSDLHEIRARGLALRFRTRPGVFSAKGLDEGTKLLLDHMDVDGAELVADLGCGAGVLGIAAAKLAPTARVHLLDDHIRAVTLAQENVKLNGVTNAEVFASDLFSAVPNERYSHVLCNAPAQLGNEFLEELVRESLAHLRRRGELWLVVVSNIKPVFDRLTAAAGAPCELVERGRHHVVLRSTLHQVAPRRQRQ